MDDGSILDVVYVALAALCAGFTLYGAFLCLVYAHKSDVPPETALLASAPGKLSPERADDADSQERLVA